MDTKAGPETETATLTIEVEIGKHAQSPTEVAGVIARFVKDSRPSLEAGGFVSGPICSEDGDRFGRYHIAFPIPDGGAATAAAPEPAYTVVGIYEGDEGQRFVEVFYTHEGPRAAEALARDWAAGQHEDIGPDDVMIAAVLDGEAQEASQ
jgi:hypothetical protein